MTKLQSKQLVQRAIALSKQLERVKPLYREIDQIITILVENGIMVGTEGKDVIRVVDNFTDKNTCFKATHFRRYDIKLEKQTEVFRVRRRYEKR